MAPTPAHVDDDGGGGLSAPATSPDLDDPDRDPPVLRDLRRHLTGVGDDDDDDVSSSSVVDPEHRSAVALPVAAIKSLLGVIRRSKAETMMGLQEELREASDLMMERARGSPDSLLLGGRSHIALASGCELFLKYVTRCFLEVPDFAACMAQVLERGERFADISVAARDRIAHVGSPFVQDGHTVLTHGWSRVVASILLRAARERHFSVVVLEGRPDAAGAKAAKVYADAGIPTTVVLDSAAGYVMERADLVVVGAEGVVENGGIVNKMGTYSLGIAARELGKPFYVAAESYKFARLFPLNQGDLPSVGPEAGLSFVDTASWEVPGGAAGVGKRRGRSGGDGDGDDDDGGDGAGGRDSVMDASAIPGAVRFRPGTVRVENPPCDYTPAKYITLLFTDLGVLTPSAVSDELIRLYQ